ncbi:Uncharacterised protein g10017 [Pycnogonum litorale]
MDPDESIYPVVDRNDSLNNISDSRKIDVKEEKPVERGNWTGKLDFLLSCLGYAVGLGNVWRFPYLCYQNGGGAFLIPYVIMLFFIGIPIFFLELSIGQFGQLGPVNCFANLCPLFKGLGYGMMLCTALVAIYYNMIIGWTFFYMFDSFRSEVQWQYCHHDFNTNNCFSDRDYQECIAVGSGATYVNHTCFSANYSMFMNLSSTLEDDRVSPAEEYFNYYMLAKSSGFFDIGQIRWQLVLCLLAAWLVTFLCLIKGIKSSGRVVHFSATFPYVILVVLFVRGITLDGAMKGIQFYIIPDWERLYDVNVWKDAAVQIFYSIGVAGGGLITLSSYNYFNNNVLRDTLLVCFGNCLTSIFAGFVTFSVLGFMATQLNVDVENVVASGPGLAFIVYPDAVSRMPLSPLWSILFFLMLFTLGLDSQFSFVETVLTFTLDQFPRLRKKKTLAIFGISCVGFILGLPLTTNGGIYLLTIMDNYGAAWPYLFVGLTECIVISYIYGIDNFFDDVKQMIGWNLNYWFKTHLSFIYLTVSPVIIFFIPILSWIQYKPLQSGDYVFTPGENAIGVVIALCPVLTVLAVLIFQLFFTNRDLSLKKRLKLLTTPTSSWRRFCVANTNSVAIDGATIIDETSSIKLGSIKLSEAYDNSIAYQAE